MRFRTKKHLALLVYLAVEPRIPHRRDWLAAFLWPRGTEAEGRHSLATALSTIRARLGLDAVEASRDHVRLAFPDLALDLDILGAREASRTELLPTLDIGSFCEQFELHDAPDFGHWCERQRARWHPVILGALERQIDRSRRTGDLARMERSADRLLSFEELSEEGIRAKMEARAFAGDRVTALRAFDRWKLRLREELRAIPPDQLEALADRLRQGRYDRHPGFLARLTGQEQPTRPFIGRGAQYQILYEGWETVTAGRARHCMVLGESGVGKTTLMERVCRTAEVQGAITVRTQGHELEREIPYAVLSGAIAQLLDRPGAAGTGPEALGELARLVPAVRDRYPTTAPTADTQGESARVRLAEAAFELLAAVAHEQPVVLVVDDLDLADDASVAVLHLLLRRMPGHPIVTFMSARPADLGLSPSASRLREAHRRLGITFADLPPMDPDEAGELLTALLPTDTAQPSTTIRRALIRASAGYPMVLELLAKDWEEHGDQCLPLSVEAMTVDPGGPRSGADAYRPIVDRIVGGLDPGARTVLSVAAILGRRLNDMAMYNVVDLSVADAMAGLGELTARGILKDGDGGMRFINELVRAHVYLLVPSPMRKLIHGKVADRLLEGADDEQDPMWGLEVAWHSFRAGRAETGKALLIPGADRAMRGGAVNEAELALRSGLPSLFGGDLTEGRLLLSEVLQEQGRWRESAAEIEHLDPTLEHHRLRARTLSLIASMTEKEPGPSSDEVESLLESVSDSTIQPRIRVRITSALARLACHQHKRSLAMALIDRASRIDVEDLGSYEARDLQVARAMALYVLRDVEPRWSDLIEAATLEPPPGILNSSIARLESGRAAARIVAGDYANAIGYLERSFSIYDRLGSDDKNALIAGNISLCYSRLGQYTEQLRWGRLAMRLREASGVSTYMPAACYSVALALAMERCVDEAIALMERAGELVTNTAEPWMKQAQLLQYADIMLVLERERKASDLAREATSGRNSTLHSMAYAGPFARWKARLGWRDGDSEAAEKLLHHYMESLSRYDRMDQAEILNASVWLDQLQGRLDVSKVANMWGVLRPIPGAVDLLDRMGMLPKGSLQSG